MNSSRSHYRTKVGFTQVGQCSYSHIIVCHPTHVKTIAHLLTGLIIRAAVVCFIRPRVLNKLRGDQVRLSVPVDGQSGLGCGGCRNRCHQLLYQNGPPTIARAVVFATHPPPVVDMPTYPLQVTCLSVIYFTPVLSSIFVALRIYTRRKLNLRLGWGELTATAYLRIR